MGRERVLLIGGSPEPSSLSTVIAASSSCSKIVAVDRGLDIAMSAGLRPDLFCGDADSVSSVGAGVVAAAEQDDSGLSFDVERYDPFKDASDLSLAFRAIYERWGTSDIVCTCLSGGRPDHALAVVGCLGRAKDAAVFLMEDGFEAQVLRPGDTWNIRDAVSRRFSLLALSDHSIATEAGMHWNLDHQLLPLLSDWGISNVVESPEASVTCEDGCLIAFLFQQRSSLA